MGGFVTVSGMGFPGVDTFIKLPKHEIPGLLIRDLRLGWDSRISAIGSC